DGASGFVWRFQTEDGNATALRAFDDERMLVNFSVWESAEALHTFVYRTQHAEVMRYRREGVERLGQPLQPPPPGSHAERKRTRLKSRHVSLSYAAFCFEK